MQTSQTGKKTWLWLGIILLLFTVISYFLSSNQPKDYPSYVSESPAPTGTKALYTYLENKNQPVKRWENKPEFLTNKNKRQLLLMIEPFFVPESEQMEEYINFMEAGNSILLLKTNPDGMFNLTADPVLTETEEIISVRNTQQEEFNAIVPSYVRMEEEEVDDVLLEDDAGVIAVRRSFGEGELIVANSPDWLTNEYITDNEHVELLFTLLQTDKAYSTILFDEYIHGSGHVPSTADLYPKWILVLALQVILLTILWLWHQGKRFGPVRQPREAIVRFSHERTAAVAAWYQRGQRYQDSLEIQADYLKLLLQEKWGIPYQRSWQESSELIIQKDTHISEKDIRSFTNGLTNLLNKASVNKQEYLAWSKKIDKLKREVEEE